MAHGNVRRTAASGISALFLCLGLLLLVVHLTEPASATSSVWYVAPGGSGTACSQSVPCSLQTALDNATDGDTIRVSQGTYHQTVLIDKSIVLEGGWNSAFTDRNWDTHITTLDAQRDGSVIQVHGSVSPTIEGFVITKGDDSGSTGWGGGIEVYGQYGRPLGTVIIRHNVITNNIACRLSTCQGEGGGIHVGVAKAIIEYNTIISNVARLSGDGGGKGGGVMVLGSGQATLVGNTISSNTAVYTPTGTWMGLGGGVYHSSVRVTLIDNVILGNTAAVTGTGYGGGAYMGGTMRSNQILSNTASVNGTGYGGGVYGDYVPTLEDNLVQGNVASQNGDGSGGGIYVHYVQRAQGNTIADNKATRGGGLFYSPYSGQLTLRDNLIVRNQATGSSNDPSNGGGGVATTADWLEIADNRILTNTAQNSAGGGILALGGTRYLIQHNQVISNTSMAGGAMAIYTSSGTIRQNYLANNLALFGGGMFLSGAVTTTLDGNSILSNTAVGFFGPAGGGILVNTAPGRPITFTNHIIARNATGEWGAGSGVFCWRGDCILINNTIVDNNLGTNDEGVILGNDGYTTGQYTLRNNIIAGHSTGVWCYQGTATLDYNDFYNNATNVNGATWGPHHRTNAPHFADRSGADYHLTATSPLIDRADGSIAPAHDFEGEPRPIGSGFDIGADEWMLHVYLPLTMRDYPPSGGPCLTVP